MRPLALLLLPAAAAALAGYAQQEQILPLLLTGPAIGEGDGLDHPMLWVSERGKARMFVMAREVATGRVTIPVPAGLDSRRR